jgi:DNA-binding FadR family transcriptional regulator
MKISTHYNRMRLLSETKIDKYQIINQHEEMISIIKNRQLDKIDEYIEKHIVTPTNEWNKIIDDNEEIRRYLK